MKVPFSHLERQFADPEPILNKIRPLIARGAFTLGKTVAEFEAAFATFVGTRYAVGVGSGTDALFLALKVVGVGIGQEVVTCANTSVATAGAIHTTGARIVFVDCNDKYVMDPELVEAAITRKTAAIILVHYTGQPADMLALKALAKKYDLPLIEDACTAIDAGIGAMRCGTAGLMGTFSLHPLNNLNAWGDGGMITTNVEGIYSKLLLMRNHGKLDRDTYAFFSFNSRLDSLQAAVAHHLLPEVEAITRRRIEIAQTYDSAFATLTPQIQLPPRQGDERHVYHIYMVRAKDRNGLLAALQDQGVEARVHYQRPLHLQPAAAPLGYSPGSFPKTEQLAKEVISLPCHQHLTNEEVACVINQVRAFYAPG